MTRLVDSNHQFKFIRSDTESVVQRERNRRQQYNNRAKLHWKQATALAIRWIRSRRHYQDNLSIAQNEHMSSVDCFDGRQMRGGAEGDANAVGEKNNEGQKDEDLLQIHPIVDGRFRDVGRNYD
jgi:5'-nucleotidase